MLQITFPQWDENLFRYLNAKNSPIADPIMSILSSSITWAIVCVLVMAIMIYKYRRRGIVGALYLFAGLATNSIVNNIIKYIVQRPRPGNVLEGVHQLGKIDTSYSFFSAHTSNSICLALFVVLYFKHKTYGWLIFIWALVVAYSRIYLGRHYPLDILCGLLFGLLTGSIAYWLYLRNYQNKIEPKL